MIQIALHWWMIPLLVLGIGTALSWAAISPPTGGMWDMDIVPGLIFIATLTLTIGLVIGHFI